MCAVPGFYCREVKKLLSLFGFDNSNRVRPDGKLRAKHSISVKTTTAANPKSSNRAVSYLSYG